MASIVDESLKEKIREAEKLDKQIINDYKTLESFKAKLIPKDLSVWKRDKYLKQKGAMVEKIKAAEGKKFELINSITRTIKVNGNGNNGAKGGSGVVF